MRAAWAYGISQEIQHMCRRRDSVGWDEQADELFGKLKGYNLEGAGSIAELLATAM